MNLVTYFMWYMFNRWTQEEAVTVFGHNLGNHIFEKWCKASDTLMFYAELDDKCRRMIVERANSIYSNEKV